MPRSSHHPDNMPLDLGERPRILLIKLAALGDMLLTTPALRALRLRYPNARIDLLTTETGASLIHDSPLINHVIVLDKYAFDYPRQIMRHPERLASVLPQVLALRSEHYDATILAHHLTLRFGRLKYRALLAAINARSSVGLDNGYGAFLDLRIPDKGFGACHEADYMLALAQALGATLSESTRNLQLADLGWAESDARGGACGTEVPAHADDGLKPTPDVEATPIIALHPGSGGYSLARRWPAASHAQLARLLQRDYGAKIILIGGGEERTLHEEILALLHYPEWAASMAGDSTPHELATLLNRCALLVANDSFPMHLAVAVGIPVVAIFGPSNHRAWGPYAPDTPERAAVMRRDDLPCSPCFYRGYSLGTPQGCPPRMCLTQLDVQQVRRMAHLLLEQPQRSAVPHVAPGD